MQIIICLILVAGKLLEGAHSKMIFDVINNLTAELNLELNVFINCNSDCSDNFHLHNEFMPKLIMDYKGAGDIKVPGYATEKYLAIAFVNLNDTVRTVRLLINVLWNLHYKDVLFICEPKFDEESLLSLFKLCWQYGFVNVLALVNENLYRYKPFPFIEVQKLNTLNEYYNKTHLRNFHGYPIRTPISNNAPRVYHYRDRQGNMLNSGYLYAFIMAFIKHYNGTFREVKMPTYTMNLTNIILAFENKEIDIVAELLYMYPNYSHSIVISAFQTYLMVPYAHPLPNYIYILKPMNRIMWIVILILILLAIALQMTFSLMQTNNLHFGLALLQTTSSILCLPSSYYRHYSRVQGFCAALVLLSGFMLTNLYSSSLASMIISRLYGPQIYSFDDIKGTELRILQTKTDITHLRTLSNVPQIIYDRVIQESAENVHKWRRDLNTSYIHSGFADKVNFYMYQQKFLRTPLFKRIEEAVFQSPLFIGIANNSPFKLQVNNFLRRIFEAGIFEKFRDDSFEEGILSGEIKFFHTDSLQFNPLTLGHFSIIFIVWSVGIFIAFVSFLKEIQILNVVKKRFNN